MAELFVLATPMPCLADSAAVADERTSRATSQFAPGGVIYNALSKIALVAMGDNRNILQTYLRISADDKATPTVMVPSFHLSPVVNIRLEIA